MGRSEAGVLKIRAMMVAAVSSGELSTLEKAELTANLLVECRGESKMKQILLHVSGLILFMT